MEIDAGQGDIGLKEEGGPGTRGRDRGSGRRKGNIGSVGLLKGLVEYCLKTLDMFGVVEDGEVNKDVDSDSGLSRW